ncbi:MAG TPA: hypothetical protein VI636_18770 [Candidatus Angelobacter sp.]
MKSGTVFHQSLRFLLLAITLATYVKVPSWAAEDTDRERKTKPNGTNDGQIKNQAPSISLTPAVVMVKARSGQTFSQELTLWNNTTQKLRFRMEARDVVIRGGKRVFVPAGEVEGSIARSAVFSDKNPIAPPGASATTRVTVTIPDSPGPRAIACIFMGQTVMGTHNAVAMTGSLGTLVTFSLADDFHLQSQPLRISVEDSAQLIAFRQVFTNIGSDPVVPKGVIAVTNEGGGLVARLPLSTQRLLPGETMEFTTEYPGALKSGKYRVLSLMENDRAFFANSAEFTIK